MPELSSKDIENYLLFAYLSIAAEKTSFFKHLLKSFILNVFYSRETPLAWDIVNLF